MNPRLLFEWLLPYHKYVAHSHAYRWADLARARARWAALQPPLHRPLALRSSWGGVRGSLLAWAAAVRVLPRRVARDNHAEPPGSSASRTPSVQRVCTAHQRDAVRGALAGWRPRTVRLCSSPAGGAARPSGCAAQLDRCAATATTVPVASACALSPVCLTPPLRRRHSCRMQ